MAMSLQGTATKTHYFSNLPICFCLNNLYFLKILSDIKINVCSQYLKLLIPNMIKDRLHCAETISIHSDAFLFQASHMTRAKSASLRPKTLVVSPLVGYSSIDVSPTL